MEDLGIKVRGTLLEDEGQSGAAGSLGDDLNGVDLSVIRERHGIIGRARELESLLACLYAGRHVLLEGPVAVGKTVLARAVADALGRGVLRVDGDGRFTEQKLVGQFDPPSVLKHGYRPESFLRGPLVQAMEQGSILFINEINRMPEGVQNVLLPALDEGSLVLPQLGSVQARPGFSVIATMNPREFVATGHLSEALLDRFELISLKHQSEDEEVQIVLRRSRPPTPALALAREAVSLVRKTRQHPRIRRGASVRAAIAIVEIARHLKGEDAVARAAGIALPGRVELKEAHDGALDSVLHELVPEKKK